MTQRYWTDPRDDRLWDVWIANERQAGGENQPLKPLLAFASEAEVHTVRIDFRDGLEGQSDADLQRLLDEGRG